MAAINYKQAGVDRSAADKFVEKIITISKTTVNKRVKASIGGYASLFALDKKRLIAASTDGVGTKLKLAFHLNQHSTVGIDLVAMSVNDILCVGAEPLFFLDYLATAKLDVGVAEEIIKGIAEGCRQAGCALVGGETAEMPDFYTKGEYDLAGFAVGIVEARSILPQKTIRAGDVLLGIRSSGCHSNGYSLLRRLLPEGSAGDSTARELLTPTRIYTKLVPLIKSGSFKGLAHITGSGFLNVPRMSERFSYKITLPPRRKLPEIYEWVRRESKLPFNELTRTFNMGIGMVAITEKNKAHAVLKKLHKSGETAWPIGEVIRKRSGHAPQVIVSESEEDGGLSTMLEY